VRALGVAIALHRLPSLPQPLPVADEPVGALRRIDADFGFKLHGAHCALAAAIGGLARQLRLALHGAGKVGGGMGPDCVERLPGLLQRVALVWQDGQSLLAHLADVGGGTRIAFDRSALIRQPGLFGRQTSSFCACGRNPAKIDFARSGTCRAISTMRSRKVIPRRSANCCSGL
jgi:hypothetical protein